MLTVTKLIEKFASDLTRTIAAREEQALAAVRAGIMTGLAVGGANVSPRAVADSIAKATSKPRRKTPPQLCPVPHCKHRAAPIFGMVCGDHRKVPKAQIKKFREARRARGTK